ncbi:nitrate- and nitrite sensing domain-containing protein [Nonomuraea sp. MCN248]|uniref:histidine kinase n=1 Tax=Nonomuraea corallina TaxID=2989783 RepID=A0ABT4SDJ0_9ACTN|nr:nitrate- and nitrite sensing domain-containing protein [Nonomuraea corallina]MDA0635271.1 nitrate- and nitrite sensing domain-containing protein [Nonomuraea corallina]
MTTGNAGGAGTGRRARAKQALPRLALRNWRVRWRLTALVLVPTLAGVVLGGARVVESVQSVSAFDRTAVAAEQAGRIRALVQALGLERDTGGWYDAARSQRKRLEQPYEERKAEVDRLVKAVRTDLAAMDESYGDRVTEVVGRARTDLGNLSAIRAEGRRDTTRYDTLLDSLLRLHDELSLLSEDSEIVGQFRALSALTRAKEQVSRQRAQLLRGHYNADSVDAKEVERFIAANAAQRAQIQAVTQEAGARAGMELQRALTIPEYYNSELTKARAVTLASGRAPGVRIRDDLLASTKADTPAPDQWFDDNSKVIAALGSVESSLAERVALRSQELRDSEIRNAIIVGTLIVGLLLIVLLLTVAIARSMVTPLRRLRTEALEIAGFRLPDVVRQLRASGETTAPEIRPIDIAGNDEIGEVARAFDQVHRQAVRLAGEEAELRGNISAMFVNLSRRTQTLVERQISLIDGLEKGEQDGGRLADLFKLDHLATRMRRNSENLLVLAGHEPTRRRSQPAKLVDVVRAALSEVEGYERVQVKVHRATSVLGSVANDLVHLVAELVENALQFSPSNAQVTVSSSLIEGGGALLSVTDNGISMTEEELADANRRLAEPPVVDVSVSRRMGLFVVGRLALRHGIRVQLRRGDGTGLIAMVLIPPALIQDATRQPLPQRPAFGGGSTSVPHRPQVPGQNGFRSYDSLDAAPGRPLTGPFGADTGVSRLPSLDPGAFPSYPSPAQGLTPDSYPSGPPARPPAQDRPGSYPSYPSPSHQGPSHQGPSHQGPSGPDQSRTGPSPADPSSASPPESNRSYPSIELPRRQPRSEFPKPDLPSADPQNGQGSRATPPGGRYGAGDLRGPGPMPSAEVSPMEAEQEEYLPIFAAVESAWFRRPPENGTSEDGLAPVPSGEQTWRTAADAGWQAAAAASDPSLGGVTSAGLPKRTPKANLVPGSAGRPAVQQQAQDPRPALSAERIRNRMAGFQQGVRRGRAEIREQEERE